MPAQVDSVGWAALTRTTFPGARDLALSPAPNRWPAQALARYLHTSAQVAFDERRFVATALPLPPGSSSAGSAHRRNQAGAHATRSLMAKSARRIVLPSPTSPRLLLVYDLKEAPDGQLGEAAVDRVWEVALGPEVGIGPAPLLPPLAQAPTLRVRAERLAAHDSNGGSAASTGAAVGSSALLSPELTGLMFAPVSWQLDGQEAQDAALPTDLFLSFGTGALRRVRLPASPSATPSVKTKRQGKVSAPSPPSRAMLVQTLAHPASAIESLSITADHLTVTSLAGDIRSYPRNDVCKPAVIEVAPRPADGEPQFRCRPYAALRNEDRSFTAVGAAGPSVDRSLLVFQSDSTGSVLSHPRSLLPAAAKDATAKARNPAVLSLSSAPSAPTLLLSGWSSPASSLCVHDLRQANRRPALSFTDRIADQPMYSCASSFLRSDGGRVVGGMGSRGHVGVFDTRLAGREAGFTVYAPGGASGRQAKGAVGSLSVEGGRIWGCTPEAAFLLDFTAGREAEEQETVRHYEHSGGRSA